MPDPLALAVGVFSLILGWGLTTLANAWTWRRQQVLDAYVDLLEALWILGQDPRVAAIDFVELDPRRDVAEITTRTFGSAILTFLAGLFLRRNDGWRGYDPTPIRD